MPATSTSNSSILAVPSPSPMLSRSSTDTGLGPISSASKASIFIPSAGGMAGVRLYRPFPLPYLKPRRSRRYLVVAVAVHSDAWLDHLHHLCSVPFSKSLMHVTWVIVAVRTSAIASTATDYCFRPRPYFITISVTRRLHPLQPLSHRRRQGNRHHSSLYSVFPTGTTPRSV